MKKILLILIFSFIFIQPVVIIAQGTEPIFVDRPPTIDTVNESPVQEVDQIESIKMTNTQIDFLNGVLAGALGGVAVGFIIGFVIKDTFFKLR